MGLSRWKVIVCLVLAAAAVWGFSHWRYSAGYGDADQHWREEWAQRDARDATALAQRQAEARAEEQRRQGEIDAIRKQASQQLAGVQADADRARAASRGCTTGPTNSPGNWQTVNAPAVPELPAEARQKPAAPYCSPTCSAALTIERGNWQKMLMKQEPED